MNTSPELPGRSELIAPLFEDDPRPDDVDQLHVAGVTTVIACIRESDIVLRDREQALWSTIDRAYTLGMKVVGDLWGVADIFGGEADTKLQPLERCPNNPRVKELVHSGIAMAADYGAEEMLWDEPNLKYCSHAGKEVGFVSHLAGKAMDHGMKSGVVLLTSEQNVQNLNILAHNPHISTIGTDPYYNNFPGSNDDAPDDYVGKWAAKLKHIQDATGTPAHMWVQGYALPYRDISTDPIESMEDWLKRSEEKPWADIPIMAGQAILKQGISNIGIWASRQWRCQKAQNIAPPDPEKIFSQIAVIRDMQLTAMGQAEAS